MMVPFALPLDLQARSRVTDLPQSHPDASPVFQPLLVEWRWGLTPLFAVGRGEGEAMKGERPLSLVLGLYLAAKLASAAALNATAGATGYDLNTALQMVDLCGERPTMFDPFLAAGRIEYL
jgi:hypothetical protein